MEWCKKLLAINPDLLQIKPRLQNIDEPLYN